MPFNGIIAKKLDVLDDTLRHLRAYLPVTLERLMEDWGLRKIVERSLQIMVETMIDIAHRIIALRGDAPPATSAEAIARLKTYGVISDDTVYARMIRFRNFLVHNYDSLDPEVLYGILNRHLSDFESFRDDIRRHDAP